MKKLFFSLVALTIATVSYSQTSFIATLQHEGEFSHFYGQDALASAYKAASTGDIITLSPGTFNSEYTTFDKGITLRGAGIEATEKTYITSNGSSVYFSSSDANMVTSVEGIIFDYQVDIQNNPSDEGKGTIKFVKCSFNRGLIASHYSSDVIEAPKVRIYNCKIYYRMYFDINSHPDFLFYNSYVENPYCDYIKEQTTTTFVNCVINWNKEYSGYVSSAEYLNFYNSIFNTTYQVTIDADLGIHGPALPNTATCYNCLSIGNSDLFRELLSGENNKTTKKVAEVFTTFTDQPTEGETFELRDAAKNTYIGTDDTPIGMQGGNYPYTTTVQYPIITKFTSDNQTNKEGILNIELEVDGK